MFLHVSLHSNTVIGVCLWINDTWYFEYQREAILHCDGGRHIDSARYYRNEDQVGRAVRESGVPREEVFVSMWDPAI